MTKLFTLYYHIMNKIHARMCDDNDTLLTDLNKFAEENELTLDYVISEFCVDDEFIQPCDG